MTFDETPLGPGEEFRIISRMVHRLGRLADGIGDDAAIIDMPRGNKLVASVDTSVENVHFKREWLTPLEIGYRAGTAALSDLAAMGAEGLGMLVSLTVPPHWRDDIDGLSGGVGAAANRTGLHIFGGDLTSGTELSISVTALGYVKHALKRGAARPGERIYVTGKLGGPGAALRALQRGKAPSDAFRERFALPYARLQEGAWLAGRGGRAGIDISDGLISDAGHIAAASGVRLLIHLDRLPLMDGVGPFDAARSGEEYELLVTSMIPLDPDAFHERFYLPLTEIGVVEKGDPEVVTYIDGKVIDFSDDRGFDHFKKV